jgi:GT2 family glycosyltransferase
MTAPRSLVVQSVLYGNPPEDLVRAASALGNSVGLAVQAGEISEWSLHLGDCSPTPIVDEAVRARLEAEIAPTGGSLVTEFFDANLGSAAGHNRLASASESELLLILNPDAQVAPDAVTQLSRGLRRGVGIVEARQVPFEHPKDYAKHTGDTSWASTACAITTREAFDGVGGFDSASFFLYCDDVDYSWRVRLAGLRVVYQPSAAVFHDKRLTVSGDWPASAAEVYYSAEAALILAHKFSRPDIVRQVEARYEGSSDETVLRALAEFRSRRQAGRLAAPIDPDHRVGQFVKDHYGDHRF